MTEQAPKHWYLSKTIIGGILALLAGISGLFGYALDAETQRSLVELVYSLSSTIGGIVAIIGRIKADRKVGK